MTVRIITDSTCDLPAAVIEKYGIHVLPLYINVGDQGYLDSIDMPRDEFYKKLPDFPVQPTTAAPSMQKFYTLYNALAAEGASEILSIHVSGSFSAIVNVAQAAARETQSTAVSVFDTGQISLGTGFMVETAAKLAESGRSAAEIVKVLSGQKERTRVCGVLSTLEFLRRSGRINSVISIIGQALQVKPMFKVYEGTLSTERVRSRKHGMKRLLDLLQEYGPFEKIAFLHTGAVENAHELMREAKEMLPAGEIWVEQLGPVLGVHIGPEAFGFACVSKN